MDELSLVKKEADRAKHMKITCDRLAEQIKIMEGQHTAVSEELNRYQNRNDQLIKQNKVN